MKVRLLQMDGAFKLISKTSNTLRRAAAQGLCTCMVVVLLTGSVWVLRISSGQWRDQQQQRTPSAHSAKSLQAGMSPTRGAEGDEDFRARGLKALNQMPMHFERNEGQTDARVRYMARGVGYGLFLTDTEAVFVLSNSAEPPKADAKSSAREKRGLPLNGTPDGAAQEPTVMRMKLEGANAAPLIEDAGELPGKINYYKGNDPARWRTGVATHERIKYREVYPGIDLVYYGNGRQLEYDFMLAPGKSPRDIRVKFEGAEKMEVDAEGDLLLHTEAGTTLRQHKPFAYQETDGVRREVASRYRLSGEREIGFEVGAYDASRPLVIDPTFEYGTLVGGLLGDEIGYGIAPDNQGNVWVTGFTSSVDFPVTAGAFQRVAGQPRPDFGFPPPRHGDAFLVKLNRFGGLMYATYLGGTLDELGSGVVVDDEDNAYVTGSSASVAFNFPTTPGALQAAVGGAFVAKFNPAGGIVYSGVFDTGTSGGFVAADIGVDSEGHAYVSGTARNEDGTGGPSAVVKINPTGSAILNTTVVPAAGRLAVTPEGEAFVAGAISLESGAVIRTSVARLNAAGGIAYSVSFPGTSGFNLASGGIDVDADGNAWVCGTSGGDLPVTSNAAQPTYGGLGDGYVVKLDAGGSIVYATYLGGSEFDTALDVAVDRFGSAYVSGATISSNFPVVNPLPPPGGTNVDGFEDAFLTRFNPAGEIVVSTTLGFQFIAYGHAVAVDRLGQVYMTGEHHTGANGGLGLSIAYAAFIVKMEAGVPTCVNRQDDLEDANPTDEVCDVDLNEPGAQCTFRAALQTTNVKPGIDSICFDIPINPITTPPVITPANAYSTITEPVIIDGTTQPGSNRVEITGFQAGSGVNGLRITAGDTTIRGLAINRFEGHGILIETKGGNRLEANYIGTDVSGQLGFGNTGDGVRVANVGDNQIGSEINGRGNVISGNTGDGIRLMGVNARGNTIQGNIIGADKDGSERIANDGDGIRLDNAPANLIGGNPTGGGVPANTISGNKKNGIHIEGAAATGNIVNANKIGTDAQASDALPNDLNGVLIKNAPNNTVGTFSPAAPNYIGGNREQGVRIEGAAASGNLVNSNFIGVGFFSSSIPNAESGVLIFNAPNNTVGGLTDDVANIISGNGDAGVGIVGAAATGNRVLGNIIGLKQTLIVGNIAESLRPFTGDAPLRPNPLASIIPLSEDAPQFEPSPNELGVGIRGASGNVIGGTSPRARNFISGNMLAGIHIYDPGANNNRVEGNYIGTNPSGLEDIGNGGAGVLVEAGSNNIVGGAGGAGANIISGNLLFGVEIRAPATATRVLGNAIGTDADAEGKLPNDGGGVLVADSAGNQIGDATLGNLISGNGGAGIEISGLAATGNKVQGNSIGPVAGGSAVANDESGVRLLGAPGNQIGGASLELGNIISGNNGDGIELVGAAARNNRIEGNYIGLDADGTSDLANEGDGISLDAARDNFVGTAAGARNVISGNDGHGIHFSNGAQGNRVEKCLIGTDADGVGGEGNDLNGVFVEDSPANQIGVSSFANGTASNVISDNGGAGIEIKGVTSSGNTVRGNLIGLGGDEGTAVSLGNEVGVRINNAPGNQIGGNSDSHTNIISANRDAGIEIVGESAIGNLIQRNLLGFGDPEVEETHGNKVGVRINGAPDNLIGGTRGVHTNVIVGSAEHGIEIKGAGATGNDVEGNFIGYAQNLPELDAGNGFDGIFVADAALTQIGDDGNRGNVIGRNGGNGITLSGAAHDAIIYGNEIGIFRMGGDQLLLIGNEGSGILIDGANDGIIGDLDTGEQKNIIAGNEDTGITILAGTGHTISGNAYIANLFDDIDLGGDGPTANDTGDADAGANNLQNYPVLTRGDSMPAGVRVEGSLSSRPNKSYRIEFYVNVTGCAENGLADDSLYFDQTTVTTNEQGMAVFVEDLDSITAIFSSLSGFSATATDLLTQETSELAPCRQIMLQDRPRSSQTTSTRRSATRASGTSRRSPTRRRPSTRK